MDLIEQGIASYDQDIGTAAISYPMHGIILGLRNLLYTAFGTLWTNGEIDTCRAYLYRAKAICEGVWRVTAPVLSSSAIDSGLDLADHEEARAEAMQNGIANGTPDAAAHGTDGIRSKVVLSSAWRAMKEVADLLETVLRLPCEAPGSVVRDVWTVSDFDSMGKCYTTWSTEIRHRGAYMALFPCYSRCCGALLSMDNWDEVRTLPIQWLNVSVSLTYMGVARLRPETRAVTSRRHPVQEDFHHAKKRRNPLCRLRHHGRPSREGP